MIRVDHNRQEHRQLPSSHYGNSWLLYVFDHANKQQAVWLHKINKEGEFIRGPGYTWRCSCGANNNASGRPLTTQLLHAAWSHFDAHLDPRAVPLRGLLARWYRGGQEPNLEAVFELEVARILGRAPELPAEIAHVCATCGEAFEISKDDPHWAMGHGPVCPRARKP